MTQVDSGVSIWRGVSRWLYGSCAWLRVALGGRGQQPMSPGFATAPTVLSCKQSGINISLRDRWGMPRRSRGVWRSFSNRATGVRIPPWPIGIAVVARAAAQQQQHQQHAARSTQLSAKQLRVCARGARLRSGVVRSSVPVRGFPGRSASSPCSGQGCHLAHLLILSLWCSKT